MKMKKVKQSPTNVITVNMKMMIMMMIMVMMMIMTMMMMMMIMKKKMKKVKQSPTKAIPPPSSPAAPIILNTHSHHDDFYLNAFSHFSDLFGF